MSKVIFKQGKLVAKVVFSMDETDFVYSRRENGTTRRVRIQYQDLESGTTEYETRYREFKFFGVFSYVLSSALFWALFREKNFPWASVLWFAIGSVSMAVYNWLKSEYTVVQSAKGSVAILRDKNHDSILAELQRRRVAQLRLNFSEINFKNDFDSELRKHAWLKQEGVISKEEYEYAENALRRYHDEAQSDIGFNDATQRIIN